MRSKTTSLLKIPFFLTPILFLSLILAFTATNCLADTDMVWTYDSGGGKDYSSLSTWEGHTDIDITSANDVVVISHSGVTGLIGDGETVTGAVSGAIGTVVGEVTATQICIDVTSGNFVSGERLEKSGSDYVESTSDEDTLGVVYLDCYDGPHNDRVEFDGATTDSNHYRCIRSASDCTTPFAGKRETGAYFESNTNANVFELTDNYSRVEYIGAKLTINSSNKRKVFEIAGDYCKAIGCVAYDSNNVKVNKPVTGFRLLGNNSLVVNCVAHNVQGTGFHLSGDTGESCYAYNCTAVDNGEYGFEEYLEGSNYVWNCVGDSNGTDFGTGFHGDSGYNMSKDVSAPGTNAKINKVFTNMWVNDTLDSENYHLSETGGADANFKGGADPADTLDPPDYTLTDDIDEDTRSTRWYRGADEWTLSVDDGSCEGLDPCYGSITSALTAATPGDTIKVFAGTYYENIAMTDGVDLVNNPGYMPAIVGDGSSTAVVTFNDEFIIGCTLDGFEISNSGTEGGVYLHGTGTNGITNTTSIKNCLIHDNSGPGIDIDGSAAVTAPIIDNNDIYGNSEEGIYIIAAGGNEGEHTKIVNNTIRDNMGEGINIGGASYLTIDNNIIRDNYAGIAFDTATPSSQPITITKNTIEGNTGSGIIITDAVTNTEDSEIAITENIIRNNDEAGIQILNQCRLKIDRNNIYENQRAGIHTGTDVENGGGFLADSLGDAILTIKQNKIYENGKSGQGAGIDVRHASGTIENNLVYRNKRAGIRFGDWIVTEIVTDGKIINNTVCHNGDADRGGGIIFDDLAGAVNATPGGTATGEIPIKNNISAYNIKAGIRGGCTENTVHNLVFGNMEYLDSEFDCLSLENPQRPDCCADPISHRPTSPSLCAFQQLGGYCWEIPTGVIYADPLFQSITPGSEDYSLQGGSPAAGAGDDENDMGAYGGDEPLPPDW